MLGSILKDLWRSSRDTARPGVANDLSMPMPEQKEGGAVIALAPPSEGNALLELTKSWMRPFERIASRVAVVDASQPDWRNRLAEIFEEPVWFAASYFSAGQNLSIRSAEGGITVWEAAGIPFLRLYGDMPAYFPDRHLARYRNSINGYFDADHAAFYRRWFPSPAVSIVLPPSLVERMPLEQVDTDRKLQGRIVFPKNGNSPDRLRDYWRTGLPRTLAQGLEAVAEDVSARDRIDLAPALDDSLIGYFSHRGIDITADRAVLCFLVAQLDDYLRRVKSTMIARALLDLPVILRGRFWEHVDLRGRRATYDSHSDVASTQALIDAAPAIVDMSPNTQKTPHDRICRAVGRGTAFLTNRQQFLADLFPDSERFCFSFAPEAIATLVEHYATNPARAVELGMEQARVIRSHWPESAFVDSILGGVQVALLRLRGRPPGTQNFVDFTPSVFD